MVGEQSGVMLEKLNDTDGFRFGIDSTGHAYLLLRRAGVEEVYESDFLVPRERWVHLAIERKGKTLTFYQDGIADGLTASQVSGTAGGAAGGTSEDTEPLTYTTSLRIGDNEEPLLVGVDLPGRIDDVRISRAALGAKLLKSVTKYSYNARNQLVREAANRTAKDYSYDKNGNTISIHETVNRNGQLTPISDTAMQYDKFNRMTSWSKSAIDPDTGLPSPTPAQIETTTYRGAEWHRTSTTANGAKVSYLYDGDNIIADVVNGNVESFYVTPFLDQNLSMTRGGQTYYYSADGLGSVRTLTDATGNVVNAYDFTAFGETYAPNTSVTVEQRYQYAGSQRSAVSGNNVMRYRTQDPTTGRFFTRDPIYYADGSNIYLYVRNLPTYWKDSFGLSTDCIVVTLIIKLPAKDGIFVNRIGLGGHAGIAIGNDYYDFGGQIGGSQARGAVTGGKGRPWWDSFNYDGDDDMMNNDATLDIIKRHLDMLASEYDDAGNVKYKHDVYEIRVNACEDNADKLRKYWDKVYGKSDWEYKKDEDGNIVTDRNGVKQVDYNMERFHLGHRTCTSSVDWGLRKSGFFPKWNPIGNRKPLSLYRAAIKTLRHQCTGNGYTKGEKADVKKAVQGTGAGKVTP